MVAGLPENGVLAISDHWGDQDTEGQGESIQFSPRSEDSAVLTCMPGP